MELKNLAPYLPYGLKVIIPYHQDKGVLDLIMLSRYKAYLSNGGSIHLWQEQYIDKIKPILRPLSDLKKSIYLEEGLIIPIDYLGGKFNVDHGEWCYLLKYCRVDVIDAPYCIMEFLFKWHFDVFGLIKKGLAIDINTIEK